SKPKAKPRTTKSHDGAARDRRARTPDSRARQRSRAGRGANAGAAPRGDHGGDQGRLGLRVERTKWDQSFPGTHAVPRHIGVPHRAPPGCALRGFGWYPRSEHLGRVRHTEYFATTRESRGRAGHLLRGPERTVAG